MVGAVGNSDVRICDNLHFLKQFFYDTLSHHIDSIPCGPLPVQNLGLQQSEGGLTKKRRKRKKKARPEGGGGGAGLRREESGEEFSDDEDMFTIDLSSDEEMEGDSSRCVCARESLNMFACMKQRGRKKERLLYLPAWYLTGEKNICWLSQCCLRSR